MKKILVLMSMFALAFGARADEQTYHYTFALSVEGQLPSSPHTVYYLIDTDKKEILAYATAFELQTFREKGVSAGYTTGFRDVLPGDPFAKYFPEDSVSVVNHNVTGILSTGGTQAKPSDPNHWKIEVAFDSYVNYTDYYGEYGRPKTLAIVAANQNRDFDSFAGIPLDKDPVTWGNTLEGGRVVGGAFTGAFSYSSVPEPTSGILLLLGMAGLALKRKRA